VKSVLAIATLAAVSLLPLAALGWGTTGHREINLVAMRELPPEMPSFLSDPESIALVADLGPEEDRLKGAGYSHDHDDDPAHFFDMGDDGLVAKTVSPYRLPPDMEAYAAALAGAKTDPYRAGYLPYAIADGWQRVRKDFAYWRVFDYLARHAKRPQDRAVFAAERTRRQALVLRDIGVWGHFVGDGSQPLHVTIHYNDHRIHALFEGSFVRAHVTVAAVTKLVPQGGPRELPRLLEQKELLTQIGTYLVASNDQVAQLYAIQRRRGFREGSPAAIAFATARVADGARELRDLIVQAWDNSYYESVGYPEIHVNDVIEGRIAPTPSAFGND
jgi:hypothetical protein